MIIIMNIIIIIIIIIIILPLVCTRGFVSLSLNHSGARYPKYNHDWIIIHFEEVDDDGSYLFLVSPSSSSPTSSHPSYIPLYMLNNKRRGPRTPQKMCPFKVWPG
jgi:hypothetical protein